MMKRFLLTLLMLSGVAGLASAECVFREDTASQEFLVGPFLDTTNGHDAEPSLTIDNIDIRISKAGGNTAAKNSGGCIHDENGMYQCTFDATDTDTAGTFQIYTDDSIDTTDDVVPVWHNCMVMPQDSYDALYAGTILKREDVGGVDKNVIATVTNQTTYIMTDNLVSANNWVGNSVSIHDASTDEIVTRWITSVNQTTETIVVDSAPPFTVGSGDILRVSDKQHPRYAANEYDAATGPALDTHASNVRAWFRLSLRSDSAVESDQATELADINADDGSGAGDFDVGPDSQEGIADQMGSGVALANATITSSKFTAGAIDAAAIATDAIGAAEIAANAIGDAELAVDAFDGLPLMLERTTIATLATQVSFTLTDGSADDSAYLGCGAFIQDSATSAQRAYGGIQAYAGSTKTITLDADPAVFTMAVGDNVSIFCLPSTTEFMNKSEVLGVGNSGDKWRGNP